MRSICSKKVNECEEKDKHLHQTSDPRQREKTHTNTHTQNLFSNKLHNAMHAKQQK